MKLARVFSNYMVLQRNVPTLVWGECDHAQTVSVKLNGTQITEVTLCPGKFSFCIPAQEAMENATLEIGEHVFSYVDFGEVWIAGGQSNMEFLLQYAAGGDEEIAVANDPHLRHYTVGQYSFAEERELGYKAWNPWDQWYTFCSEHAADFSAVGVFFAKELRRVLGVPVGIINCSWGGTSASAWMERELIQQNPEIRSYVEDFDSLVASLDLERYHAIKSVIRPGMASPESKKMSSIISKNTFHPKQMAQMLAQHVQSAGGDASGSPMGSFTMEEIMAIGPGDPSEPGALYENMLREIMGYGARGVIWYQGESDDKKPDCYSSLFSSMIRCWRRDWNTQLPFIFAQLAPYGTWMANSNEKYPILRAQQELVSKTVPGTYMASISDIGNVFDIHPKEKKLVGQRMALLAQHYIYDIDVAADAPEATGLEKDGDTLKIRFANAKGLYLKAEDFSSYNGFAVNDIDPTLLPPVLAGVNGLQVWVDGAAVQAAKCNVSGDTLCICAPEVSGGSAFCVEFANTGFYQVNLYNQAGIPVKPFVLKG